MSDVKGLGSIPKLTGGTNLSIWTRRIKEWAGISGAIYSLREAGATQLAGESAAAFAIRKNLRNDQNAKVWFAIMSSLDPGPFDRATKKFPNDEAPEATPYALLNYLTAQFKLDGTGEALSLYFNWQDCTWLTSGDSLDTYVATEASLYNSIVDINPAIAPIDFVRICHFKKGLPEDWNTWFNNYATSNPIMSVIASAEGVVPVVKAVTAVTWDEFSRALQNQERMRLLEGTTSGFIAAKSAAKAALSRFSDTRLHPTQKHVWVDYCTHCGRELHLAERCHELHPELLKRRNETYNKDDNRPAKRNSNYRGKKPQGRSNDKPSAKAQSDGFEESIDASANLAHNGFLGHHPISYPRSAMIAHSGQNPFSSASSIVSEPIDPTQDSSTMSRNDSLLPSWDLDLSPVLASGDDIRDAFVSGTIDPRTVNPVMEKTGWDRISDPMDYEHTDDYPSVSGFMAGAPQPGTLPFLFSRAWIIDSGASQHMTGLRGLFTSFTTFSDPQAPINGIGGTSLVPQGRGTVRVHCKTSSGTTFIDMTNVLYVPGMTVNLLSMSAFTDKGAVFTTGLKSLQIAIKRISTVLSATRFHGLYFLDTKATATHDGRAYALAAYSTKPDHAL